MYNYIVCRFSIMGEKAPVYDNHVHMDPSGRNVDAAREFEAAGGTGMTLVTLPYEQVPITRGEDFLRSYEITLALADAAREATRLEINVAVGPYPVLILPLSTHYGLEKAEEMMLEGMEAAAELVREGKACAIGEIGRPHCDVPAEIWDASNRILLRGMEHAKELDCPVIIHSESGTPETNRSLSEMAKGAGLDPGLVVKHSSPPFVTEEETFGIMPSIPASKKNIAEALGKGTTRFMLETDYIDDPERPGMMMPITTVPNKIRTMLSNGRLSPEDVDRICRDIPDRLYHR
jgi:TatD-related deoxyribonuclease